MKKFLKYSLYGIMAIVAILFIASLFTPTGTVAKTENETATVETEAEETTLEWTMVSEFKGSGQKTSAPFILGDGDKKVMYAYQSNNSSMGVFAYYVVPKGKNIMKEGGFPEVMTQETKVQDESYLNRDPGEYQIVANATGNYVIQIWEMRPVKKETASIE